MTVVKITAAAVTAVLLTLNSVGCDKGKEDAASAVRLPVRSWDCGDAPGTVTCAQDSSGTLTVSGVGAVMNYRGEYDPDPPEGSMRGDGDGSRRDFKDSVVRVVIESGVTGIGAGAFRDLTGLRSVMMPNSIVSIGDNAFSGCTALSSVTIPVRVKSIGDSAFFGCSGLKSVSFQGNVQSIGKAVFFGCAGISSVIIPSGVTAISEETFRGCTGLTSVTIPNSVTSIGRSAFRGCVGLHTVTIPKSVRAIDDYAFSECGSRVSFTMPDSVTSIGWGVFDSLAGVKIAETNGNYVSSGGELYYHTEMGIGILKRVRDSAEAQKRIGGFYSNDCKYFSRQSEIMIDSLKASNVIGMYSDNNETFRLRRTTASIDSTMLDKDYCGEGEYWGYYVVHDAEAVFMDFVNYPKKEIRRVIEGYGRMAPGDKISFDYGNISYELEAFGRYDSTTLYDCCSNPIVGYSLVYSIKGTGKKQALVELQYGTTTAVEVQFIGDLDGDGKPDVILKTTTDCECFADYYEVMVFLSSTASKGNYLNLEAGCRGTGVIGKSC